jgi:tRNA nucleotidyltransferase (CCA-adding enzyme)
MRTLQFNFFKSTQDWMTVQDPAFLLRLRRENGWLADHLPEVDALYGVPQDVRWHPEVDTGIHTEMTLAQAAGLTESPAVRFAALLHDLGKGSTNPALLPKHVGHEEAGVDLVNQVCDRLEVPTDWRRLSILVCQYHLHSHRALEMSLRGVVRFFREAGFYKAPEDLEPFLLACLADRRGRGGLESEPYLQREFLLKAFEVSSNCLEDDTNRLNQSRIAAVNGIRKLF